MGSVFAAQVSKDLLNHHRIFDAGNHPDVATAALADLDVDVEDPFQALRPGHGGPAFCRRGGFRRICRAGLVVLAAFSRRHLCTMRAMKSIGSKMTCVVPSRHGVLSS
jgi:hypothetical protein